MPKIRTHSGTAKRVRVTKTGKIQHGHASTSHFLQKKSAASKRRSSINTTVVGKARNNIKRALGV